jgi:hypothetical protein
MLSRKLIDLLLSVSVVASLVVGGGGPLYSQDPTNDDDPNSPASPNTMYLPLVAGEQTSSEVQAAAKPVQPSGQQKKSASNLKIEGRRQAGRQAAPVGGRGCGPSPTCDGDPQPTRTISARSPFATEPAADQRSILGDGSVRSPPHR